MGSDYHGYYSSGIGAFVELDNLQMKGGRDMPNGQQFPGPQATGGPVGTEDFFDWDQTPDSNVFPAGTYQMSVQALDDGLSKGTSDGIPKRMFVLRATCELPAQFAGMTYFENFVTGSKEAPNGMVPGSMGTRNFKQLMKGCQIPKGNSVAQLLNTAVSSQAKFMVQLSYYEEKEGEYAGTPRNRLIGYFKLGERAPVVAPVAGVAIVPGPVLAPPVMPGQGATTGVPPVVSPDTGVTGLPSIAPQPVVAPPVQPVAAPQPQVFQSDPAVPQTQVAPPAAPPVTVPPQPPATPAAGGMIRCTICQQDVAMAGLAEHVEAHRLQGSVG